MSVTTASQASLPIDELVQLLNKYAPEELQDLQRLYPESVEGVLNPEGICGDTATLPEAVDTCLRTMQTSIKLCDKHLGDMNSKLRQASSLQIYGKMLSAISSASIFGLLQDKYRSWAYVATSLALIGTLLPDIAKLLTQVLNNNDDMAKIRLTLISLKSEALGIEQKLIVCKLAGYPEMVGNEEAKLLINNGSLLAVKIREELEKAGMDSSPDNAHDLTA